MANFNYLKPCPLCGCADITIHSPNSHGFTLFGVACDRCSVRIKRFDKSEAVAAWNTRVPVQGNPSMTDGIPTEDE